MHPQQTEGIHESPLAFPEPGALLLLRVRVNLVDKAGYRRDEPFKPFSMLYGVSDRRRCEANDSAIVERSAQNIQNEFLLRPEMDMKCQL